MVKFVRMWLGFSLLFIMLHITVGCFYVTETKEKISGLIGGSVVLPCRCNDLNTKPQSFKWRKLRFNNEWDNVETENHKIQLLNTDTPGNLSLLILDLTENHAGLYRCDVGHSIFKDFNLTVEGTRPSIPPSVNPHSMYFFIPIPLLLLLLLLGGIVYWRLKARRRGQTKSSEGQTNETNQQDKPVNTQIHAVMTDLTYSVIVHKETPRSKWTKTEEKTEYASIKLD